MLCGNGGWRSSKHIFEARIIIALSSYSTEFVLSCILYILSIKHPLTCHNILGFMARTPGHRSQNFTVKFLWLAHDDKGYHQRVKQKLFLKCRGDQMCYLGAGIYEDQMLYY